MEHKAWSEPYGLEHGVIWDFRLRIFDLVMRELENLTTTYFAVHPLPFTVYRSRLLRLERFGLFQRLLCGIDNQKWLTN